MIHIENLTKFYGDFCAVNGISLDIKRGEIVGLLGPNGAGKSTTLRMLTGYYAPSSGDIRIKDYSISENLLEIKDLIGYLPESAPLYHSMLVFDYLEYIASLRGLNGDGKLARIKELANLCGLNHIMHKAIGELSKGLKQRVGLAHAMMADPEILILDEPTSGLDPNQIVEIREIIKRIGKEKTVILSTHILSEAEATCDRIVIIHKGKVAADGTAAEIKKSAGQEKSILIALANAEPESVKRTLGELERVSGIEVNEIADGSLKVKLSYRVMEDLRETVYRKIKETDWVILGFTQEALTLENLFREITKEA